MPIDPHLSRDEDFNQYARQYFRSRQEMRRRRAMLGDRIMRKPQSKFSDKEDYLPLDLWDSTPDP